MTRKRLKKGFTTGAAAAAAVKAALIFSLNGHKPVNKVNITFLTGETRWVDVDGLEIVAGGRVQAMVVKDAGDDPDVTHKALIGAVVSIRDAQQTSIIMRGGKGVGQITKPGLELPVGEPAINPGPRKMIRQSVDEALSQIKSGPKLVDIEIVVPEGEILAKKTLNARLGIIGGISILGTTGIVTPMSHDAYIATIKSSISVAAANDIQNLVFTTGRRSERFAMGLFGRFKPEAFIQTGDFFKASIDMAVAQKGIRQIIYTIFFGKAVKMALGFEHTHAAKSELTLKELAGWAGEITKDDNLVQNIETANTARHAFSYIHPGFPELIAHVGEQIRQNASQFSGGRLDIRSIIFDFEGSVVFDSKLKES